MARLALWLAVFAVVLAVVAVALIGYGLSGASGGVGCVQRIGAWSGPCSASPPASVIRPFLPVWHGPGVRHGG